MQENLINPQAVDAAVQAIFGSYEKFVLTLIQRRKGLEAEKLKLHASLKRIKQEEGIIKKVLSGYHGKKINGLYYDADKNDLTHTKPATLKAPQENDAISAIGELLSFNKEPYNEKAGEEVITEDMLHAEVKNQGSHLIQERAADEYKHDVLSFIEKNYLPDFKKSDLSAQVIDHNKLNNAFKNGLSPQQFAEGIADDFKLTKIHKQSVKIK